MEVGSYLNNNFKKINEEYVDTNTVYLKVKMKIEINLIGTVYLKQYQYKFFKDKNAR